MARAASALFLALGFRRSISGALAKGGGVRLSTRGRYAVMAMADLAAHAPTLGRRAMPLAEIAERQQISLPYLEQLFARLRCSGLVQSVRGPGGGYRLAQDAASTWIADIVHAVDEPLRATRCTGENPGAGCLASGARCLTHGLWDALGRQIEDYLASVSLEDVVRGRLRPDRSVEAA